MRLLARTLAVSLVSTAASFCWAQTAPASAENAAPAAVDPFESAPPARAQGEGEVRFDPAANTIDLHVVDTDIALVLRMLTEQTRTNILASKEVRGTVTASLYRVSLKEALDAILKSNGFVYREEGNFIYVYSAGEVQQQQQVQRKMRTELFRLYYTPVKDAEKAIRSVLSEDAKFEAIGSAGGLSGGGGAAGSASGGSITSTASNEGDVLVVTDYDDNLAAVARVIKEIDTRPAQVLVEATIVIVRLTEENKLGVNLTVLGGVDFSTINGSTNSAPGLNPALNGSIITGSNGANIIENGYIGAQLGGGGLKMGVVHNNISLFLEALETTADTMVLANPKLLVLNKQQGEVRVGREIYYRDSVTVTDGGNSEATASVVEDGTTLRFRPYVSNDGFIRLEVMPEESTATLIDDQFGKLPQKDLAKIVSTILVRDGSTVVIGGLFRESDTIARSQTPGLGNLPLVGPLFRSQNDTTRREEILILLTPHVIKDSSALADATDATKDRLEQMRVGVRRGMMWFGRERLAEGWYRAALEEMARPDADKQKARWFIDAAINLNPKFIEAIELRQQLTGEERKSVDNALTRDLISRVLMPKTAPAANANTPAAAQPVANTPVVASTKVNTTRPVASTSPAQTAPAAPAAQAESTGPAAPATASAAPTQSTPPAKSNIDESGRWPSARPQPAEPKNTVVETDDSPLDQ